MIKKLILSALLLVSSFILFGCGSSPRDAAEGFYACMADADFEGAKEYASPATQQLLDLVASMGKDNMEKQDFDITFVSETIDGDSAVVIFRDEAGDEQPIDMTKIDGEWKVDVKK